MPNLKPRHEQAECPTSGLSAQICGPRRPTARKCRTDVSAAGSTTPPSARSTSKARPTARGTPRHPARDTRPVWAARPSTAAGCPGQSVGAVHCSSSRILERFNACGSTTSADRQEETVHVRGVRTGSWRRKLEVRSGRCMAPPASPSLMASRGTDCFPCRDHRSSDSIGERGGAGSPRVTQMRSIVRPGLCSGESKTS